MRREILFRGKHICNGEWCEGSLLVWPNGSCMIKQFGEFPFENKNADVQPETVGQFTGLTDKRGQKIFEGDVVRFEDIDGEMVVCVVLWGANGGRWELDVPATGNRFAMSFFDVVVEVIGNLHDNPELLEVSV